MDIPSLIKSRISETYELHRRYVNPQLVRVLEVIGYNRNYRQATVRGELHVGNHRATEVELVIRRQFSGQLVNAEGEPEARLREEGVASVNQRRELVWSLQLAPGEEKRIVYRYQVLVAH